MSRLFALSIICSLLLVLATVSQVARAQAEPAMTEEQIARIRQNCVHAQSSLNQLHASDALLRVNRGPQYELISTKLMAPLNSRIALNRLGGIKLASTTLEYDHQFDAFVSDYRDYEESMSHTLEIRCTNEPVSFYDSIKDTREKRLKVHDDIVRLNELLQTYKTIFEEFSSNLLKGNS